MPQINVSDQIPQEVDLEDLLNSAWSYAIGPQEAPILDELVEFINTNGHSGCGPHRHIAFSDLDAVKQFAVDELGMITPE